MADCCFVKGIGTEADKLYFLWLFKYTDICIDWHPIEITREEKNETKHTNQKNNNTGCLFSHSVNGKWSVIANDLQGILVGIWCFISHFGKADSIRSSKIRFVIAKLGSNKRDSFFSNQFENEHIQCLTILHFVYSINGLLVLFPCHYYALKCVLRFVCEVWVSLFFVIHSLRKFLTKCSGINNLYTVSISHTVISIYQVQRKEV